MLKTKAVLYAFLMLLAFGAKTVCLAESGTEDATMIRIARTLKPNAIPAVIDAVEKGGKKKDGMLKVFSNVTPLLLMWNEHFEALKRLVDDADAKDDATLKDLKNYFKGAQKMRAAKLTKQDAVDLLKKTK